MKKLWLVLLAGIVMSSVLFSGTAAFAQENQEGAIQLPNPGILPDSPLYVFDNIAKNISLFFTFDPEAKAQRALLYAEERLAEAKVMAAKGKANGVNRSASGYDKFIELAAAKAEEARQKSAPTDISEKIATATTNHLSALDAVMESFSDVVPDQARQAISRAREASMRGAESALIGLAQDDPEKAAEILMNAAENRVNRAKSKAQENDIEEVEETVNEVEKLFEFGAEISAIAREIGKGETTVDQLIARTTVLHLDVLTEVYNRVPEQAKSAIEDAMTKAAAARENAVANLKEAGTLNNIPEELPIPEHLPDEVKQRLQQVIPPRPTIPNDRRP